MKKIFSWSEWGIATKILFMFLGISVISMGIIGIVTNLYIRDLGSYGLESSTSLGYRAITDSTAHLNQLGEEIIEQKSRDVARQVEMYLDSRPAMTLDAMRADARLREIVVQSVGVTGYTTLIDPVNAEIIIHKFPGQEKNLDSLQTVLPTFWTLLKSSASGRTSGYYDWLEVDGSTNKKFAGIEPVVTKDGRILNLWATTYISEFSMPAEQTREEINAAIQDAAAHINKNVNDVQNLFFIIFTVLIIIIIAISLLLSRVITSPIHRLKQGAEAVGKGNLDYKISVKNKDELGDLARSFNDMAAALKDYTEQFKNTANENVEKERRIQDSLRTYMRKVGQAQEDERKRISRELHDDTIQALVVVSRDLEDISAGAPGSTAGKIREEVRRIIEVLRNFSQELRPSILDDLGLIPALKWLASDLEKKYGIHAETEISGTQRSLPPEAELMLFRITQEAMTNIRRHSGATKAAVKLNFTEDKVKLVIWDNGKGFESPTGLGDLAKAGKLGLVGMRERAQLLGGTLHIDSHPSKGTELTIVVPQ